MRRRSLRRRKWESSRTFICTTRKPGRRDTELRLVDPYHLANINGEWYLSNAKLSVDNVEYPIYNLKHGFIGVRIGDEVNGQHVHARSEADLVQAVLQALHPTPQSD